MKVEKEQLGASRWALTVEVPLEEIQTEVEEELEKLQQTTEMPGFRRGRVPLPLIRQKYTKALQVDLMQKHLGDYYERALQEAQIGDPVASPEFDIVQFDLEKPLIFKAVIEVQPPIEVASYEGFTVVRELTEVTEEEVEKHLQRLRENYAIIEDDSEPVGPTSILEADIQLLDSGFLPIIGQKSEAVTIDLSRSSPEFRDSLLGIKNGEDRNVSILIPPKTPQDPKQYDHYQIRVKAVKRKVVPELNDDFAKKVKPDLENVQALQDTLKKQMQAQIEAISFQRMVHLLVHQVVDNTRVDVPERMVQDYLDRMAADARKDLSSEENEKFDEPYFRDQLRGRSTWNLKWYLIRKRIAENEGITISDDDFQKEYEQIAAGTGKNLKIVQAQFSDERKRSRLEDDLLERRVLQVLVSKAQVIERSVTFQEFFTERGHEHDTEE
ncbi:MAG: trigger factor [bacterium]